MATIIWATAGKGCLPPQVNSVANKKVTYRIRAARFCSTVFSIIVVFTMTRYSKTSRAESFGSDLRIEATIRTVLKRFMRLSFNNENERLADFSLYEGARL
jgi:hypothetical protein